VKKTMDAERKRRSRNPKLPIRPAPVVVPPAGEKPANLDGMMRKADPFDLDMWQFVPENFGG
jgi:hypothetical protein